MLSEDDDAHPFQSAVRAMCYDAGVLLRVWYGGYRETPDERAMVRIVRLDFENGDWSLIVNPDDDTLRIAEWFESDEAEYFDPPGDSPWRPAVGMSPRWIWVMSNQQGYLDGIQFEFVNARTRSEHTVQMMALGSEWYIYAVITEPSADRGSME